MAPKFGSGGLSNQPPVHISSFPPTIHPRGRCFFFQVEPGSDHLYSLTWGPFSYSYLYVYIEQAQLVEWNLTANSFLTPSSLNGLEASG